MILKRDGSQQGKERRPDIGVTTPEKARTEGSKNQSEAETVARKIPNRFKVHQ